MITIQKVTNNVQSVPRQSPYIYWHTEVCSRRPVQYSTIVVDDWKCIKYCIFACFCTVIVRCTETFRVPCILLCFRWTEELTNLKSERERLVGDCLISASFLSYTGAFSWEFRRRMVYKDWEVDLRNRNVPLSKPFRLETTLANGPDFTR
jgi:hypothetical protein